MSSLKLDPIGMKLLHSCYMCCSKRGYSLNNVNDNFDFTSVITRGRRDHIFLEEKSFICLFKVQSLVSWSSFPPSYFPECFCFEKEMDFQVENGVLCSTQSCGRGV